MFPKFQKIFVFRCSFVFFWLFFLAFLCCFLFVIYFIYVFSCKTQKLQKISRLCLVECQLFEVFFLIYFSSYFFFYLLLFAFKINPKIFLCPFVLLKFFEKTTKIFRRSFSFFFGSLFHWLFVETLKIFYLCFASRFLFAFEKKQNSKKYFYSERNFV